MAALLRRLRRKARLGGGGGGGGGARFHLVEGGLRQGEANAGQGGLLDAGIVGAAEELVGAAGEGDFGEGVGLEGGLFEGFFPAGGDVGQLGAGGGVGCGEAVDALGDCFAAAGEFF